MAVMTRSPALQAALTVHHRDFSNLSDADIETALRQLAALGALDE